MKVLIIPEYGRYGGTLSFFKKLLDIHREHKINTAILINREQNIPELVNPLVRVFEMPVRPKRGYYPGVSIFYDVKYTRQAIREYVPDLVVISNGMPGLMMGVLACDMPVLFIMHTYPLKRLIVPSLFMKMPVFKKDYVFMTVSQSSARQIKKYIGIPEESIEVVYNSVKTADGKINKSSKQVVLTLGHLSSYKNPGLWLEVGKRVIERMPDTRFIWLGDGEQIAQSTQLVEGFGLANNIEFRGYVSNVEEFYDEASVYFQPSRVESQSLSVLSAMAKGIPCVTSDAGGLPESVVNGTTGFTCPVDDVEGYVSRITDLLSNPALREQMGKAGRQRAAELFSEEEQERKIIDLYKRLAEK